MAISLEDMSARDVDAKMKADAEKVPGFLVSADSHVDEPLDLWDDLPASVREQIPERIPFTNARPKGGLDPKVRMEHMEIDGIAAEILYPTATLKLFELSQEVQEAAFPLYNDWIADYCKTAPDRMFAIPALSTYDIDHAVKELQRCHDMGLTGGLMWQVPEPSLPLYSDHYEKLWSAAEEMGAVINFHILTGFNYKKGLMGSNYKEHRAKHGWEKVRGSVNIKTADAVNTAFDMIWSGVFERHPKLKVELVEGEIGWIPFILQQWDYYYHRNTSGKPGHIQTDFPISRKPSAYFNDHVYATFMDDLVGAHLLEIWGENNCMWSSDYPHANMTWPNSRAFAARQIGDLPRDKQEKLLSQNVIDLYGLKL